MLGVRFTIEKVTVKWLKIYFHVSVWWQWSTVQIDAYQPHEIVTMDENWDWCTPGIMNLSCIPACLHFFFPTHRELILSLKFDNSDSVT